MLENTQGCSYRLITEVLDFGPYVVKAVLYPKCSPAGATPQAQDFRVSVTRRRILKEEPFSAYKAERRPFPTEGERTVTAAYVSDENGSPDSNGICITLELACIPGIEGELGSLVAFDEAFSAFAEVSYEIALLSSLSADGGTIGPCVFNISRGNSILLGDLLEECMHADAEVPIGYSLYDPKPSGDERIPLLIWLHGMGEGGTETRIAAVANKVVHLISPEIQAIFGGKAYLIAPQAPTWWMDPGDMTLAMDGRSLYLEPLYRLVRDFLEEHPQVDRSRVYIGGDSNGGYMTVNQVLHHPELYAAAFPVCEAYLDDALSDGDIRQLSQTPIWFTAAKTDPVVPVDRFAVPTYLRLKAIDADVHFTLWDKVEDHTGHYMNEDGTPYEYMGHLSWIPMLNNENRLDYDGSPVLLNGRAVTMLEWIAAQRRKA